MTYAALHTPGMATHGAPGLVPKPCCISRRQNIYFRLLRGLICDKSHSSTDGQVSVGEG